MKFSARVFIFLSFLFFFLIFKSAPAFAQTATLPPQNLHNYTQNVMIEVMSSMTCVLAGVDAVDPNQKCLGIADGKIGPVDTKGGAIGAMGGLIAATFTIPIHSTDYVRYVAGNFGITKNVYAQEAGIGFQGLSPLINIWTAFRNITYILFILIFLVIGFAIMLRVHIDPRTVMTVENQIPKIIIGIILVTFSFAIVGLLVDLMWVLIYVSIGVFSNIPGVNLGSSFDKIQGLNALEVANNLKLATCTPDGIGGIVTCASSGVGGMISGFLDNPGGRIIIAAILGIVGGAVTFINPIAGVIAGVAGVAGGILAGNQIFGLIGSVIASLIIGIAVLFALFRLWFSLIKAYVMILVVAVFSPFWVLAGLLPGSRLTFGNLLRELGSNLITFPATIIMFLLGKTFIDVFSDPTKHGIFVPPLIGNPGDTKAIGAIVGLGIILLAADVNKLMRKALQAPEFDFAAIFKAIGVGAGFPTTSLTRAGQLGYSLQGVESLQKLTKGFMGRFTSGGVKPPPGSSGGHGP